MSREMVLKVDSAQDRLPQSAEAEMGLLSSMLQKPSLIDDYSDLSIEVFLRPSHACIFEVLSEMAQANRAVDHITVTQILEDKGLLESVGGAAAVTDLFTFTPTWSAHRDYAGIVREKWVKRCILSLASSMHEIVGAEWGSLDEMIGQVESGVLGLRASAERNATEPVQHCQAATLAAVDYIEAIYSNRGKITGISSGIKDLDRMTNGFQKTNMIVIAARPAQGKTALAMNIAEDCAVNQELKTLVFSLEMSKRELMTRVLCKRAEINLQRVRDGFLGKNDIPKLIEQYERLVKSRLFIDDTAALSTAQFRARARMAKMKYGIEMIVVDYLQLMKGVTKGAKDNRQQEVSEISGTIKAVAKELDIPVIVLAQLRRDADERKGPPKLIDLRESGSIEQDADVVILIHRLEKGEMDKRKEDLKKKMGFKGEHDDDDEPLPYNTDLILAKQRQGPVGEVHVRFVPEYTLFEGVTKSLYSNNPDKRQQ